MSRRRTKKRYTELYDNPTMLSAGGANDAGAKVILFPNGEREIWVQSHDGLGYRITVSDGPYGLGMHVTSFVGTPKITVRDDASDTPSSVDTGYVALTQYRQNEKSQAYKRWYDRQETPADVALLGPEYKR